MSSWFDAEDHADRALEMYERGRWAEAEAELRKALALNPDQAEWHFNLGLTLEAAQRDGEALSCYERSVSLMPGQVDPLVAAGMVANRLGEYERAIDWFAAALRLDSRCEAAYAHQIESYLRLGRHEEAETTFYLAQQALEERSAHCLAMVAESLIARGHYGRAEWCLWEAIRIDASLPRLRARLGAVYSATGRARKALQLYLRDLRDDPGNIDTLLDYGEALLELGRLPEAAEKFRRVLELEPANVDAHFRLGQIALQAGRAEQAHLEFELVLKLDPQYPQIRSSLGSALLRRGRHEDARHHLREEVAGLDTAAQPDETAESIDAARLGGLLLDAELFTEAAEVFERAVAEEGADADQWRRLALARYRSGDRGGGMAASRRALRLDRRCVISMHNLALAALEEGRLRTAAGWIARGLRADRHDEELRRLRLRLWWARLVALVRRLLR